VNEANRWGADYFISLHTNAASSPSASGTEAYAYARGTRAFAFGEDILDSLTAITGLRNRGMQARPGLYVLRKTQMPAVLVELGFITNPGDAALMRDDPGLFAEGIYRGILDYTGG
jgi:N-acetylmuramoyl-L-alanine amidase